MVPKWSQSDPESPSCTRKRPQSDQKVLRPAPSQPVLTPSWLLWALQKCLKNQCFFNIFAFRPHPAPSYTHHTCHLRSFGSIFHFPTTFFKIFLKMSSPPRRKHNFKDRPTAFVKKNHTFRRRNGPTWACFGHVFRPYRSAVQSFPLLSAPCPPSWTSQIFANMCIIATGGFLGRLEPCIRHHFDDIFMSATLCWWHFVVSDMILNACFTFGHHFL